MLKAHVVLRKGSNQMGRGPLHLGRFSGKHLRASVAEAAHEAVGCLLLLRRTFVALVSWRSWRNACLRLKERFGLGRRVENPFPRWLHVLVPSIESDDPAEDPETRRQHAEMAHLRDKLAKMEVRPPGACLEPSQRGPSRSPP